jgi:hypothetical protein
MSEQVNPSRWSFQISALRGLWFCSGNWFPCLFWLRELGFDFFPLALVPVALFFISTRTVSPAENATVLSVFAYTAPEALAGTVIFKSVLM